MSVIAARPYSSRWGRLIPIAFITYSLAYVDRANYSFGAAGGMAHDLNITAAASSLLGALSFSLATSSSKCRPPTTRRSEV